MTGIIIHDLVKVMLTIDPSGSNKKLFTGPKKVTYSKGSLWLMNKSWPFMSPHSRFVLLVDLI